MAQDNDENSNQGKRDKPSPDGMPSLLPSANPHDAMFRVLMDDPERARTVLRDYLPPTVLEQMKDAPPKLIDGTFVDDDLRLSQSDRLFEVELKTGDPALVYTLLEHKSQADPMTPLQMLKYMVRIWERYARNTPGALRLPMIIPMIFYNGPTPWKAPLSFFDIVNHDEELHPWVRQLTSLLHDLGNIQDARLASEPAPRAILEAMKYVLRTGEFTGEVMADIWRQLPDNMDLKVTVTKYILWTIKTDWPRPSELLEPAERENLEALMDSLMERRYREGKDKGRQEGELAGKSKALARLLEKRFGALPGSVRDSMAAAPEARLDAWLDAAIDARSLQEVFGA